MVSVLRFLGTFLLAWGAFASDVRVVEVIVAKVNNEIITSSELDRGRRLIEAQLRRSGTGGQQLEEAVKERTKDVLRDRIDQLLLVQKGKDLDINVDSEVTKELANIQLQNKIADQDKFQQWIREQSGMPFEDFKAEMRNDFLKRRVIGQEVGSRISIPRAEARDYYDKHKEEFVREERVFLSEILLSTQGKSGSDPAALEKKAKELVTRARNGERFGELARDNSDADSSSTQGQLGAFKRSDLNKDIAQVVFSNDRGYVTDPIKVANGFLILRVDERHQAGQAAFEEVENEIMEKLYMPRFEPAIRTYLTKLREEAFLEIREGYADTGAAPGKDTGWRDPAQLRPQTVTREEIATRIRRKRLLWLMPLPGTKTSSRESSSVQQ
jgi:parvulin-like peptidyl-prolyl isomerase